ncbi:MAG: hypothetical protein PHY91_08245 [Tissierellia bacterium]|nr:hypothetical protein [Tissierellia bacterium]
MEDIELELLEKLYIDMQEMKINIKGLEQSITTKQDKARLENKMDANDKALYNEYKQIIEVVTELNEKLDKLNDLAKTRKLNYKFLNQ